MENLPAQLCPLCQQPNDCAIAQTGNIASQCWCMHVKIDPEVLAQLTAAKKNTACICKNCSQILKP